MSNKVVMVRRNAITDSYQIIAKIDNNLIGETINIDPISCYEVSKFISNNMNANNLGLIITGESMLMGSESSDGQIHDVIKVVLSESHFNGKVKKVWATPDQFVLE